MCLSNKCLGNADAALWDLILRTTVLEKCVPMRLLSKEARMFSVAYLVIAPNWKHLDIHQ